MTEERNVPQLLEAIDDANIEIRRHAAAYGGLMRAIGDEDSGAGAEQRAPLFSWVTTLGPKVMEVATDLGKLSAEERAAALTPLANMHATHMLAAVKTLRAAVENLESLLVACK